jgi:hypothetical protein
MAPGGTPAVDMVVELIAESVWRGPAPCQKNPAASPDVRGRSGKLLIGANMENRVTDVEQAIVERNITLGVDLIALRNAAGSNREFSRMARRAYDIDPARAALYARVARAYGDRRDITSRVNWKKLVALATASEPVRLEFEERIVRGERIGAADIKQRR